MRIALFTWDYSTSCGIKFAKELLASNHEVAGVFARPAKEKEKICLMVKREDGKIIRINEVFVKNYNGSKIQRGLWVSTDASGSVNFFSTLGKFMRKYGKNTIEELKGLEIELFIGEKDLLVGSVD